MIKETDYPGIDYSGGTANTDPETGIHYGVISMNALGEWALEDFPADYGDPTCPDCGRGLEEYDNEKHGEYEETGGCFDYACEGCEKIWNCEDSFPDESVSHILDDGKYKAFLDSHNDVFLVKSPYYTHAQFCSPCCPGAGHLENPCPQGPKTYCFGKKWFPNDEAPYPVYDVKTGKEML